MAQNVTRAATSLPIFSARLRPADGGVGLVQQTLLVQHVHERQMVSLARVPEDPVDLALVIHLKLRHDGVLETVHVGQNAQIASTRRGSQRDLICLPIFVLSGTKILTLPYPEDASAVLRLYEDGPPCF